MGRYILNRILWMIPIVLGITLIVFALTSFVPGDPATVILGSTATKEEVDALNEELGYSRPFWVKYFDYLLNLLKFDFGTSYVNKQPVRGQLYKRLKTVSLPVAGLGVIGTLLLGVPLGVLSAVKQYSLLDTLPTAFAMVLSAAPSFWLGLIMMLIFSLHFGWLPSFGMEKPLWWVLPMVTVSITHGSNLHRFTRSSMLETIRQDYIRTVRSKGATERVVIWRHALKNALLPVVTILGTTFASLIGGAIVTETLYSLPGIGSFIVKGVQQKDIPVVLGGTLTIGFAYSVIILLVDILYAYIDPKIKAKYARK